MLPPPAARAEGILEMICRLPGTVVLYADGDAVPLQYRDQRFQLAPRARLGGHVAVRPHTHHDADDRHTGLGARRHQLLGHRATGRGDAEDPQSLIGQYLGRRRQIAARLLRRHLVARPHGQLYAVEAPAAHHPGQFRQRLLPRFGKYRELNHLLGHAVLLL